MNLLMRCVLNFSILQSQNLDVVISNLLSYAINTLTKNSDFITAISTALLVFVGFINAVVLYKQISLFRDNLNNSKDQFKLAEDQFKLAEERFKVSQRAWIKPEVSFDTQADNMPISFDNAVHVNLKFCFKNSGNQPATNVFSAFQVYIGYKDKDFYLSEQKQISEGWEKYIFKDHDGYTIFPGDEKFILRGASAQKSEIDNELKLMHSFRTKDDYGFDLVPVSIIGVIIYRTFNNPFIHHSYFAYDVGVEPFKTKNGITLQAGLQVPVSNSGIPKENYFLAEKIMEGNLFFAD